MNLNILVLAHQIEDFCIVVDMSMVTTFYYCFFLTCNQCVLADIELETTSYVPVKLKLQKTQNIPDILVVNIYANMSRFGGKAQELLLGNVLG